jgi:hypothetical protein
MTPGFSAACVLDYAISIRTGALKSAPFRESVGPADVKAFAGITGLSNPEATFIQFRSDGLNLGGARF